MEYQIIIDTLENSQNQLAKFWTKNWVEVNDESRGTYNTDSHIKFKCQDRVHVIAVLHIYL